MQMGKKVPLWRRGKEVHLGHGKGLRKVLWTEAIWNGDFEQGGGKFTPSEKGSWSVQGLLSHVTINVQSCLLPWKIKRVNLAKSAGKGM